MAGIYVHIPFCHTKCAYCDFYKVTNRHLKSQYLTSVLKELELRKDYLQNEEVNTIYFGGGTPSVFSVRELKKIIDSIFLNFKINNNCEITLEANPDDLFNDYIIALSDIQINRLSIGVQSFFDEDLKFMGRRHSSNQAIRSIEESYNTGFDNISIDLIYGLPGLSEKRWAENLNILFSLPVIHLSAYHLTYHKGTKFYNLRQKGLLKELSEDESVNQYEMLIKKTKINEFVQYEISNFAKNNAFSIHNKSYWFQKKYLGIGPSAHSYNCNSRQWNISDLNKYISKLNNGLLFYEIEYLNDYLKINEYIMTSLRTMWGVSKEYIKENFGKERLDSLNNTIQKYAENGLIIDKSDSYILTSKGLFISDNIISELMINVDS